MLRPVLFCFLIVQLTSCGQAQHNGVPVFPLKSLEVNANIKTGASRTVQYLPLLEQKRVAVVANQTSLIGTAHLVDSLLALKIQIVKVFAPEHGFRGEAAAGEHIKDGKDQKTGLSVVSLYGKNKKPTAEMLKDVDIILFDIQDVGARFYTYISTMHYVMEASAENNKEVIVLDRPNPNGFYIDGPVLKMEHQSFVGMHPIPLVHGCTVGELANMINGEGWLKGKVKCNLTVIPCVEYSHKDLYHLPVKPSPNLPNAASVYLYPSLCLFEATAVSVGRGTELPFQCIGYPGNTTGKYEFTPKDQAGVAMDPQYEGQLCTGHNLQEFGEFYITSSRELYMEWLTGMYERCIDKKNFFTNEKFFDQLAGSDELRKQLVAGTSTIEIRKTWKQDIDLYKVMRKQYLLYPDFE
ncbi:MAG: exo-beta-N-acetylmuramidase NamZ domain-containing protein [Flavobacteriales bacterium]